MQKKNKQTNEKVLCKHVQGVQCAGLILVLSLKYTHARMKTIRFNIRAFKIGASVSVYKALVNTLFS